jgi:hypothetical protein
MEGRKIGNRRWSAGPPRVCSSRAVEPIVPKHCCQPHRFRRPRSRSFSPSASISVHQRSVPLLALQPFDLHHWAFDKGILGRRAREFWAGEWGNERRRLS